MRPYRGLAIIFGFYALGEFTTYVLNLTIPGSVLGMLFLLGALLTGAIKLEWVEGEAELFVRNMSVMFIPPGVGIVTYLGLIKSQVVPISVALILSFLVTLVVTAKTVELLRREEK
ncbi:effector of murein hydrolase LrgA [Thermococcus celericrescens]|uniref:Effector of murein hydrolase LrgA n=1 Tax=Thermococcus celericrescens TaxID=227598 RepID=A0A100XZY3_9EURY|nr:CidA/LrgA family protein [Thermococcus celericrescens]KUH34847.1 effector of murein hydrolase LrgA [Thermococcus celericrescens]